MTAYMVQIAKGILGFMDDPEKHRDILLHASALNEGMKRLDPRDFLPDTQYPFVVARLDLDAWVNRYLNDAGVFLNQYINKDWGRKQLKDKMEDVISVLEKYGGEGWRVQTRSFAFIKDKDLREIIERDYKELTLVLFPGGAWKSTVILAGSILEAILFDRVGSDSATKAKALASPQAPKAKGKVLDLDDWKLDPLIRVAADIGILPKDRADTFDQVLRDYRNFVHPKKEIKAAHPCGEGEAQLAIGGLNAVCDILNP